MEMKQARKAPSYASLKLRLTNLPTGMKCRATSLAKKRNWRRLRQKPEAEG